MPISYGSVCSGIEAATQAWHPLGMRASWFAEIEPFPSAVLAYHYPNVPNHGDMIKLAALVLAGKIPAPDVLVGGTPCQAFSVAGMREGLTDPRGALTIKYVELADAVDYVRTARGEAECVLTWENVPGVLSDKGNAFGCFLGALAGEDCELQPPGKKWQDAGCVYGPKRTIAWRVLDAQYFGLAQRRRRVFVVASARDGFDPTEVLFEREGVRRDTAPRRGEKADSPAGALRSTDGGSDVDHTIAGHLQSVAFGGGANCEQTEVATALSAHPGGTRMDAETETFVVTAPLTTNQYGDHESRKICWLWPARFRLEARLRAVQHNKMPSRACWSCTAHKTPVSAKGSPLPWAGTTARKTRCWLSPARITALTPGRSRRLCAP
ncbi:hypothetical protein PS682_04468 [Pseudomonas fluorescens]|nr:hypothetical protein PS682_04468 [Pseudomonas fluorescens]